MDGDRFDRLATGLGRGLPRRRVLLALFGGAASGVTALSTGGLTHVLAGPEDDGGQDVCGDAGKNCHRDGECCGGACTLGRCGCPPGTTECNGRCRRCPPGRVLNPQTCRCERSTCDGAICGGQCVTCAPGSLLDTATCQCVTAGGCPAGMTACGSTCCGSGQTCVEGVCLCPAAGCTEPGSTVCANNTCCPPDQICNGVECCTPLTPQQCPSYIECGPMRDPCTNRDVDCGACSFGYVCQEGHCVAGCGSNADCGPCQFCNPDTNICQPAPSGTVCGAPVCSGSTLITGTCDGAGTCGQVQTPCQNGCENGACRATCSGDFDCPAGQHCSESVCVADECQPGTQRSCYSGPAGSSGVGICHSGIQVCQSNGTWGPCNGEVTPQPQICNGLDNNCDGVIDTGSCPECNACGAAGCAPVPDGTPCASGTCQAGACVGCPAGQVLCNGTCVTLSSDPNNCGTCGNACSAPNTLVNICTDGHCGVGACVAGFADCDGDPANGCEVNINLDSNNCGACGNVCASGQVCQAGTCVASP